MSHVLVLHWKTLGTDHISCGWYSSHESSIKMKHHDKEAQRGWPESTKPDAGIGR